MQSTEAATEEAPLAQGDGDPRAIEGPDGGVDASILDLEREEQKQAIRRNTTRDSLEEELKEAQEQVTRLETILELPDGVIHLFLGAERYL